MLGMVRLKMCISEGIGVKIKHKTPLNFMRKNATSYTTAESVGQLRPGAWFTIRSILTRWLPFGTTIYAGWFWHKTRHNLDKVSKAEIDFYKTLPLRMTSRLWGRISRFQLPDLLRPVVYGSYAALFNVNLEEAASQDYRDYSSLSEFFARALRPGARVIDPSESVCPCDGYVLTCGPVTSDSIEQVKGVTYSLEHFLGDNKPQANQSYYYSLLSDKRNILHQCVIYLAPGDYHRFHSPCDWTISLRRHFCGKLLSVNPSIAKLIPGLFCLNERVVYTGCWKHGFFSYTAVGATNVGSIEVYIDGELRTNATEIRPCDSYALEPVAAMKKGEILGQFNMGSTIVLIFEAPKEFQFIFEPGHKVKMGQELGFIRRSS